MRTFFISCLLIAGVCSSGLAQASETLAKAKGCLVCHTVDKKVVGPAYKDIAKRYAGQKDAQALLTEKVLKGGKGVWKKELGAELPMPPNPAVKPDEAAALVKWILTLK